MSVASYASAPSEGTYAKYSWEDVQAITLARMANDSLLLKSMRRVRDAYNGDVVVPLTDVKGEPLLPATAPAVIADSIDYIAMRAASSRPSITVPAIEWEDPDSRAAAAITRRAYYARWHDSALTDVLLRRTYRHWAGYGTGALAVVPDFGRECARIEVRDPLGCYPDFRSPDDVREPCDVAFVYSMSGRRLAKLFPEARDLVTKDRARADESWDIVEWIDETQIVIGLLGRRYDLDTYWRGGINARPPEGRLLRQYPNRAGMTTVAIPRRATLERVMGIVEPILGSTDLMDRLMALEVAMAEKGVYPDMVVTSTRQGVQPVLVNGSWRDGRTGEPNLIVDGRAEMLYQQPGPATQLIVDRLERRARIHTGLIPQAGGETTGALRTGRAVDAIGGLSLDPRIQEAQELVARTLMCVNESIGAVEKGWWPKKKTVAFSGWPSDFGHVTYVPEETFAHPHNVVTYSLPGVDISQASVALPQLVGAGLMSRRSAMRAHPFVEDPDQELKAMEEERITEAVFMSLLEQARTGSVPLIDLARIGKELGVATELVAAVMKADQAARERQATPPEVPPDAPPGALAPEQVPGLAAPGMGAEAIAQQPIPGPTAPQDRFRELVRAITAGGSVARRGPANGAQ